MQSAHCGARAGNLAGAHHRERRAAPRRGDRRRIPAAAPEARRIRRSAHGRGTRRSRDGATPGERGGNIRGHIFRPQRHRRAATGTGARSRQHRRHSGRRYRFQISRWRSIPNVVAYPGNLHRGRGSPPGGNHERRSLPSLHSPVTAFERSRQSPCSRTAAYFTPEPFGASGKETRG